MGKLLKKSSAIEEVLTQNDLASCQRMSVSLQELPQEEE
jgi:hypothetical protein